MPAVVLNKGLTSHTLTFSNDFRLDFITDITLSSYEHKGMVNTKIYAYKIFHLQTVFIEV